MHRDDAGVFLIGAPGCGKSAIGRMLAADLGARFVDLDSYIENQAGCGIAEIFDREQESGFRRREVTALRQVTKEPGPLVVATGGGIVLDPANRELLAREMTIFIDADESLLWDRIRNDSSSRPLLSGADPRGKLGQLVRARRPLYKQLARHTIRVDADSTVTDLVQQTRRALVANAQH